MELKNDKVILRAPELGDLDALYRHENAPEVAEHCLARGPVSRLMLEKYIEAYSADINEMGSLRLMIVERKTGETVGSVDLYDYNYRDRRAYVSVFVESSKRRLGLGKSALEILCHYASEILGLHQLAAETAADNEGARKLFERMGFKTCGRLRSWLRVGRKYYDVLVYQRLFFN